MKVLVLFPILVTLMKRNPVIVTLYITGPHALLLSTSGTVHELVKFVSLTSETVIVGVAGSPACTCVIMI